jgi:hypothetical protein
MLRKSFVFCITVIFLFSCKQKQETKYYYPVPEALKKACLFHKDSYWVYRNDTTGATDSTYVKTEPVSSTYQVGSNNTIESIYSGIGSGFLTGFTLDGRLNSLEYILEGYPFFSNIKNYGICCGNIAFIMFDDSLKNHSLARSCQCGSGSGAVYDYNKFEQLGEYQDFKVNELLFDKVAVTRAIFPGSDSPGNNDTVDYYFSPGNGIIKVVMKLDTSYVKIHRATISWSLLRYNAVQ